MAENNPTLSIVVPAYNEESVLHEFYDRTVKVMDGLSFSSEIIFINDGSTDRSLEIMKELREKDKRVAIIDLSRNFGKEIALTAGLDHARGEIAIPIDADLQDPPEFIPEMIKYWEQGYNVVNARRASRQGESWLKLTTASMFYRLVKRLDSRIDIPANVGDFRLIDRKALDALSQMREQHRFMKGLFSIIGFNQITVKYERDPRFDGISKFNYWKLWNFSLEGITSFTTLPLRLASYMGVIIAAIAFIYGIFIFFKTALFGDPVQGFPTLFVAVSFLGGIQLLFLGVIGEYLGRMFNETKRRPLYFTNEIVQSEVSPKQTTKTTKPKAT